MPNDKTIKVELDDYMLYDKLNLLSVEYATTVEQLVNISIKRLLTDVEFFRQLRKGNITPAPRPDAQT